MMFPPGAMLTFACFRVQVVDVASCSQTCSASRRLPAGAQVQAFRIFLVKRNERVEAFVTMRRCMHLKKALQQHISQLAI